MLLLCITGLPLIFHHEIDDLLHSEVKPAEVPPGTPNADLDRLLANALANSSVEGAAFPDLGSRRSQRDVRQRRRVHHFRPHEQSLRPDGFAYRRLSRFARRHRPLHLHHAQAARRHVRRLAGQAVPWIDGDPVLCRHHIRHRGLCAVDAEAGFRHLPRPPPAHRALARHPQSGGHPAGHVDARGRLYRRDQHLGRSRSEDVAVRPAGRDDGAIPRSPAAHQADLGSGCRGRCRATPCRE